MPSAYSLLHVELNCDTMLLSMQKSRIPVRLFVNLFLLLATLGFRKLPLGKGLFYRIYSRMKNKYGVVRIMTNDDVPLLIDLKDNIIATFLIEYGEWEPGLTRVMKKLIKPGMRVIDIGAHVGYSTTLMSKLVGPTGAVTSFEPEPYNYSLLVKNAGASRTARSLIVAFQMLRVCLRCILLKAIWEAIACGKRLTSRSK